ncbi:MAG: methylated-DNA--[protein]-cysteine S-methyltransferase [Oscillospiraceae bacterium]|jgi:methylated-DNA-[protein]-cysteine S-methyltransferase|nr:methylated-DNA--[protein]-cysteine S-methyltransferase [Oscillospiraceae bacterium]
MSYICKIASPVGALTASSDGQSLTGLWIEGQKYFAATLDADTEERDLEIFEWTRGWLDYYFLGNKPEITPPLAPGGSKFRQLVWNALMEIPYGTVTTYGDLAKRLSAGGNLTSARAVGGAVGHNPISIIIPCHRVVGADGSLTGYAGGVEKKRQLLELEKAEITGN